MEDTNVIITAAQKAEYDKLRADDSSWRLAKEEYHDRLTEYETKDGEQTRKIERLTSQNATLRQDVKRYEEEQARYTTHITEIKVASQKEIQSMKNNVDRKERAFVDKSNEVERLDEDNKRWSERYRIIKTERDQLHEEGKELHDSLLLLQQTQTTLDQELNLSGAAKARLNSIEDILQEQFCGRRGSVSSTGSGYLDKISEMTPRHIALLIAEVLNAVRSRTRDGSPDSFGPMNPLRSKKSRMGMGNRTNSLKDELDKVGERGDDEACAETDSVSSATEKSWFADQDITRRRSGGGPSVPEQPASAIDRDGSTIMASDIEGDTNTRTPRKRPSLPLLRYLSLSIPRTIAQIEPVSPTAFEPTPLPQLAAPRPPQLSIYPAQSIASLSPSTIPQTPRPPLSAQTQHTTSQDPSHEPTTTTATTTAPPPPYKTPATPSQTQKPYLPTSSTQQLILLLALAAILAGFFSAITNLHEREMWRAANDDTRSAVTGYFLRAAGIARAGERGGAEAWAYYGHGVVGQTG